MKRKPLETLPAKANLRPDEIAAFLDCSVHTVYRLLEEGRIPTVRLVDNIRGHLRIPRAEFLKWYDAQLLRDPD